MLGGRTGSGAPAMGDFGPPPGGPPQGGSGGDFDDDIPF